MIVSSLINWVPPCKFRIILFTEFFGFLQCRSIYWWMDWLMDWLISYLQFTDSVFPFTVGRSVSRVWSPWLCVWLPDEPAIGRAQRRPLFESTQYLQLAGVGEKMVERIVKRPEMRLLDRTGLLDGILQCDCGLVGAQLCPGFAGIHHDVRPAT